MSQLSTFSSGSGGGGITTINGNTGSITGATVTIESTGEGTAFTNSTSATVMNLQFTDANSNIGIGTSSLSNLAGGSANVCMGYQSGVGYTTGIRNVGIGYLTLSTDQTGTGNIAIGFEAGPNFNGGNFNTLIGYQAGSPYGATESYNISIGSTSGTGGENGAVHIGDGGNNTTCFIGGISGVMVTGDAVLVTSANNQLGTATSSARYKDNIQDMGDSSALIHNLRPVTFTIKNDESKQQQYGLIAEEVHEVMPHLVGLNKDGQINTVRYHELPALLLNEIQKLRKEVDELKRSK